jgi:ATP-dependent DNA helicase RecG
MNLEELLCQPEGKTLEFKATLNTAEPFLRSVVAFANTAGGTILLGVEDKTRRVLGLAEPLILEERVANLVSDAIRPRLVPDIAVLPWRRVHLVAVRVFPSPNRPHYLKAAGPDEGVYVRVGSTDRKADRMLVEELRRYARNMAFDEQIMVELDSEALDFRAASELFSSTRRLSQRDLTVLSLAAQHQGTIRPTIGGVLLFGRERERLFPDAYIQAGRFGGRDRSRILDTLQTRGHLPIAVEEALAFVRKHASVALAIRGARHEERWTFPQVAVREAVINAVVHADYTQRGAPIRVSVFDDRLEIENPGLLPFGLTMEDVLQGVSKLRNRVIGRVFKELGLIEQWGSGIARMITACRDADLADPVFEEIGWHFRVTIRKDRVVRESTDPIEAAILELLRSGQGHATAEIARAIGRTPRATRTRLAALVARGLVAEVGTGPQDPKRKYYLAE